jgi:hypothetical protein
VDGKENDLVETGSGVDGKENDLVGIDSDVDMLSKDGEHFVHLKGVSPN